MSDILHALIRMHQYGENDQHGYHFHRPDEGYNGVVYCATATGDKQYAVKIARRGKRRRAWREFTVTRALHMAGITTICPKPWHLFVEHSELDGDVVVSDWLAGAPMNVAPAADERSLWQAILDTLQKIHSLTPLTTTFDIEDAAVPVYHPEDLLRVIRERLSRLPEGQSGILNREQVVRLVDVLHERVPHRWDTVPRRTLVHGDCHPANMLWDGERVMLVDWENAGWSDPAIDISNMISQWRFFDLPAAHHRWLTETYAQMLDDTTLPQRVQTYSTIQTVHWVVNYSNFIRQNADNRPQSVHRFSPDFAKNWQVRYWHRAQAALSITL